MAWGFLSVHIHKKKLSGQLYAPVALIPGKLPSVTFGYGLGWTQVSLDAVYEEIVL
jgi:hypothetical protein